MRDVPSAEPTLAASPARTSAPSPDDSDDFTVMAKRRRGSWQISVIGGESYELVDDVVTLGRLSAVRSDVLGIVDDTRTMSKRHARLEFTEGAWHVTDLHSTNGTYLRDTSGRETEISESGLTRIEGVLLLGDLEARVEPREDS